MDSARETLLAELAGSTTGLGLIDGSGVYSNKLRVISRDILIPEQCGGQFPAAIMLPEGEPKTRDESAINLIRSLEVSLLLYVQKTSTSTAMSTAINSLAAEVKFAWIGTATQTHGGDCMLSFFDDMDELGLVHENIGAALMRFHFIYNYLRDTP